MSKEMLSVNAKHLSQYKNSPDEQGKLGTQKNSLWKWLWSDQESQFAIGSGVLLVLAWLVSHVAQPIAIGIYLLAYVVGGYFKGREGLITLVKEKDLDVNLLMILAAAGAAIIGYWAEGAMLIFIFAVSGALENYTLTKSKQDISALVSMNPEHAILYQNNIESIVPVEELNIGDLIIVKPGQRIPADGMIVEGYSAIDEATITGESIPVDKAINDDVYAGTLNGQGSLMIKVTKTNDSTLFSKVIRMVQEAQEKMPARQSFIERFERIYAWVVIGITAALIVIPPVAFQMDWKETFYKSMVFLVVASPCALVASIMPVVLSALSNCSRKGILLKGGVHLETLANAKAIAFDKTGTLTKGKPMVKDIIPLLGSTENDLLSITASLESLSTHPIALAIVSRAKEVDLSIEYPTDLQSITGSGIEAKWRGDVWRVGKPSFIDAALLTEEVSEMIQALEQQGKTVIVVQNSTRVVGILSLRDQIRPEARKVIETLKKLGIVPVMLTGDQRKTAEAIGREAGIEHIHAELLPQEKGQIIEQLREKYGSVVMIGDGVNDAPALAVADVGVAMGGAGSDAALETADLVLMNDDLTKLGTMVSLSRKSRSVIRQNITFALTLIILLIGYNFIEGIALPLGVIFHEGSTILVILNGLRLLR